jgi:lactoylglutathione lyase
MNARLEHVGLWVADIDRVATFYAKYFGAQVGELYRNARKGFESRFLSFGGGARLEVMTRKDVTRQPASEQLGLAHVALCIGDEAAVDALAVRLQGDGVAPESGLAGRATATTNAWCATRKAIASRSRRKDEDT